jgi:hypothetical protein
MKAAIPCLLIVFVMAYCTVPKQTAYSQNEITNYKNSSFTWSVINAGEQKEKSSIFFSAAKDSLIKKEVNNQLEKKGMYAEASKAKLLVSYCIMEEQKLQTLSMAYKERYGHNSPYVTQYPDTARNWLFMLGVKTIIIDLHDARTNKLVWRGWNSFVSDDISANEETATKETVEEIFRQFPGSL